MRAIVLEVGRVFYALTSGLCGLLPAAGHECNVAFFLIVLLNLLSFGHAIITLGGLGISRAIDVLIVILC
jgi:hypothetical protein